MLVALLTILSRSRKPHMAPDSGSNTAPPNACYANVLLVGYNAFEFLLDFRQSYSPDSRESTGVRIVTMPVFAKAMLETLQSSIAQYEDTHGPIPAASDEEQS